MPASFRYHNTIRFFSSVGPLNLRRCTTFAHRYSCNNRRNYVTQIGGIGEGCHVSWWVLVDTSVPR